MAGNSAVYLHWNDPCAGFNHIELLRLKIIAGHKLLNKDIIANSDPYTQIKLIDMQTGEVTETFKTKTINNDLNPKWDEEFLIKVDPEKHKLLIKVYDENYLKDSFLGRIELILSIIPKEHGSANRSGDIR